MNLEKEDKQIKNREPIFEILKVYVKNLSFDTPNVLQVSNENLEYKISLDLNINSRDLENHTYEVSLNATITNKAEDKIVFLIEITQVGIFFIKNFSQEEVKNIINIQCPSLLFPDICEIVTNLTTRGGFKPLYLKPIDI